MSTPKTPNFLTSQEAANVIVKDAKNIFIIYSHSDLRIARQIRKKLIKLRPDKTEESIFLDQDSLIPGVKVLPKDVEKYLREADLILVLCGRNTASRPIVMEEINISLGRMAKKECGILPIILKSGVRLPDGLDYEIQAIFLTVLFPEIKWQRISTFVGSGLLMLAVLAMIARSTWALWIAPAEGWTAIQLTESGFDQAVLVQDDKGREGIKTFRKYIERGTFAEDVDNTNHLILEFDLLGNLTGSFATFSDDAGSFVDKQQITEYGGLGTLEGITQDIEHDVAAGEEVWINLNVKASQCMHIDNGNYLENLLEILHAEIPELKYNDINAFQLETNRTLVVIRNDISTSRFILINNAKVEKITNVGFLPKGILAISKQVSNPNVLFMAKSDTRWEDEGSEGGLFKSEDYGNNWSKINLGNGMDTYLLSDIVIGLGSSNRIALSYNDREGGIYGVKISDNLGETWKSLDQGLTGNTAQKINLVGVAEDESVIISLPGGRLAHWRTFSFGERFMGVKDVQL